MPINVREGKNMVTLRRIRLNAVWYTAFCAHTVDFPTGSAEFWGSKISMPFSNSVRRMNHAFKKPALAHARKALKLLSRMSWGPASRAATPRSACLIERLTTMELVQAAE